MYNPYISIIIPVYNRELTLSYCIDSILNQEYSRWELLLIDDGSTDHSAEICKLYAQRDSRIKYIYQKNQGAGPARNKGIENSSGEWITFVDSDDAIMPDHLSQVQKNGEGNDLLMVNHCKAKYINGELMKETEYWRGIENIQISNNNDFLEFLYVKIDPYSTYNYCCWDKFFNMGIIKKNNLRFPSDVPTGQDMMFVVDYFKYVTHFYFSNIGTYAPTPKGNVGINHLALQLRLPIEFLHCHLRNYENLMDLYRISKNEHVREYATNYILTETFVRSILRYTNWRNRRVLGKNVIVQFMSDSFKPIIGNLQNELDYVKNELYRKQFKLILQGKSAKVYDYWFYKNAGNAILRKIRKFF